MPSKQPAQRLADIVENIQAIAEFTAGMRYEDYIHGGEMGAPFSRLLSRRKRRLFTPFFHVVRGVCFSVVAPMRLTPSAPRFACMWCQLFTAPVTLQDLGIGTCSRRRRHSRPLAHRAPENRRYPAVSNRDHRRCHGSPKAPCPSRANRLLTRHPWSPLILYDSPRLILQRNRSGPRHGVNTDDPV